MKVSKTVSIEIDLLQKILEENNNFSHIVTEALQNWLYFKNETEQGNAIHFSRIFKTKIPPKIVWRLMSFDGLTKWIKMIKKTEYLTDQKKGLGTKCKLYGQIEDVKATSIAEITEYNEYERMVYRSQGDFRIFSSATLTPKGSQIEVAVIIIIGLSDELVSAGVKGEIQRNLESAFGLFEKVATTLS